MRESTCTTAGGCRMSRKRTQGAYGHGSMCMWSPGLRVERLTLHRLRQHGDEASNYFLSRFISQANKYKYKSKAECLIEQLTKKYRNRCWCKKIRERDTRCLGIPYPSISKSVGRIFRMIRVPPLSTSSKFCIFNLFMFPKIIFFQKWFGIVLNYLK